MAFVMASEILLYLCFSILMGSFILTMVPSHFRPGLHVSKRYMILAAIGIALFSFTPILVLIINLQQRLGWQDGLQLVLLTFDIGNAWVFTTIIVLILLVVIVKFYQDENPAYSWIGFLLTMFLIIGLAWSSHASSLEQGKGFLTHIIHFTAVTVWVGIMYVASWFSKNHENWLRFLQWFTPLAISCVLLTTASGISLMGFVMDIPQYPNSWMIDYGQYLLIKHLLIISLLVFAVINGIFIRRRLMINQKFNPVPWMKAESIVAILVFSATAAMSQQSPPSASILKQEGLSFLFELFYQGQYVPGMDVHLSVNSMSIFFIIIAFLFSTMIFYTFFKKTSPIITVLLSVLFVLSSYLAIIMSIN